MLCFRAIYKREITRGRLKCLLGICHEFVDKGKTVS